ncbi:MAG: hypothetical protein ACPGU1_17565 [Myxococcota bacterium]
MTTVRFGITMLLAAALIACGGDEDNGEDASTGFPDTSTSSDSGSTEDDTSTSVNDTTEPEDDTDGPEDDTTEPEDDTTEPEDDTTEPEDDTTEPEDDTTGPEGCQSDDDCAAEAGCCQTGICNADGVCEFTELDGCCEASSDCDDSDDQTNDVCSNPCSENGCEYYPVVGCDDGQTYVHENFDGGTVGTGLVVDLAPSDSATVGVSGDLYVTPGFSLHFGVPGCPTYYSGPLNDCVPADAFAGDSTPLNLEYVLSSIELEADSASHLTFWIDMAAEPALDLGGGTVYDVDYLTIYIETATDNVVVWKSTEAFGVENNSDGFVHQAIDLSEWAGETVTVHFNFITDGAGDWSGSSTWHGAYLDDILVETSCEDTQCAEGGQGCPSDGDLCTNDVCTGFSNGDGGICAYEWASPGSACDGCVTDADCGTNDACNTYTCDAGNCSNEVDSACCNEGSSYPATGAGGLNAEDFEGDNFFTEWSLDDEMADNISWQLSTARAASGNSSLYMGDPSTMTYAANPVNPAKATAWSPIFTLAESSGSTVLSFELYMSTEYDGSTEPCPADTWDVLSVWVTPVGADPEMVWASNDTICNTTNGAFVQIGVDLADYEGKVISVGFDFDSGDSAGMATLNDYEGVYIDDISVSSWCADECMGQSDCGGGDACTDVWCELGTCMENVADANCCVEDSDCAGDNACATGTCNDGSCEYNYSDDPTCCSETWMGVATEGFEGGLGGFTTNSNSDSVVWHVTDTDAWMGTQSVNFSDPSTGTYASAASSVNGQLWSPAVMVPPFTAGTPYVEFQMLLETEWDDNAAADFFPGFPIDELCVGLISMDDAASYASCMWDSDTWHTSHLLNTTRGAWMTSRVDLSDFVGQTIHVVWEFEADQYKNDYAGPFIDDVAFGSACSAVECIDSSECASSDSCYMAACEDFVCVETPIDSPLCCFPGADDSLTMDFESGPAWDSESCTPGDGSMGDASSVWQVSGETAGITPTDGSMMLYFGNGTDYGGDVLTDPEAMASCGSTSSPEFVLNPAETWTLEFDLYLGIEANPNCAGGAAFASDDAFTISVIDYSNAGTETLLFDKSELNCGDFGDWTSISIDLNDWSGQSIGLRFAFDSGNAYVNDGPGIAVDNMQFVKGCE